MSASRWPSHWPENSKSSASIVTSGASTIFGGAWTALLGAISVIGNRAAQVTDCYVLYPLRVPTGHEWMWIGWIVLHIAYLLGGRNRVQTLINLGARYFGPRRSNAIVRS